VLDLDSADPIRPAAWTLERPEGQYGVTLGPQAKMIAVKARDQPVILYYLSGPNPKWTLKATENATSFAFSQDGSRLAELTPSGSRETTVRIWDLGSTEKPGSVSPRVIKEIREDRGELEETRSFRWLGSPDLIVTTSDRRVHLWDPSPDHQNSHPTEIFGHDLDLTSQAIDREAGMLAHGSLDGSIRLWNLNDLDPASTIRVVDRIPGVLKFIGGVENSRLARVAILPGRLEVTGMTAERQTFDLDPNLTVSQVLDTSDRHVAVYFSNREQPGRSEIQVFGLDSPKQKLVLLKVFVFDKKYAFKTQDDKLTIIFGALITPDGRRLAVVEGSGFSLYDLDEPRLQLIARYDGNQQLSGVMTFSPDSHALAAVSDRGRCVQFWELTKPGMTSVRECQVSDEVGPILVAPGGRFVAWASYNEGKHVATIWIWDPNSPLSKDNNPRSFFDLKNTREVTDGLIEDREVLTVGSESWTFSTDSRFKFIRMTLDPRGDRLAAAAFDHLVRIWDLRPGPSSSAPPIIWPQGRVVTDLAFSPDGSTLAAMTDDEVRLGDLTKGNPQANPRTRNIDADQLFFSPDGKKLALLNQNDPSRVWSLDAEVIDLARRDAVRNLTLAEWAEYFPGETYRPTFADLPSPTYDPAFGKIAGNLSRAEWTRRFPGVACRSSFPDRPIPPDPVDPD